ncbi:MAG: sensor histidine kinase [Armatimonadota bacterium]
MALLISGGMVCLLPWVMPSDPEAASFPWRAGTALRHASVLIGLLAGCWGSGLFILAKKRRLQLGEDRRSLQSIIGGLTITGLGLLGLLLLPMTRWYYFAFNLCSLLMVLLLVLALTVVTVGLVSQHRAIGPRIALRSSVSYLIATVILGVLFSLLAPFLTMVIRSIPQIPYSTGFFLIAILIALLLHPLKSGIDWMIDRLFYRSSYDFRQTLQDAGVALTLSSESEILITILADIFNQTFIPQFVALYLPNEAGCLVRVSQGIDVAGLPSSVEGQDDLQRYFATLPRVMRVVVGQTQQPPSPVMDQLTGWGVAVAAPLLVEKRLCGVVVLGRRCSGESYRDIDLALVQTLCRVGAVALDNARHYAQLRVLIAELEQRVEERTRGLSEANAQLQQVDQAKDQFLAVVSHELLSPLTGILGWSEFALLSREPDKMEKALDVVYRNGQRLRRLVDDLLDISRIIHGKLGLFPQLVELWQLVEQSVESMHHLAVERNITIELDPPDEALFAMADPARIMQVVSNLLNNSLKFTEPGGTITVRGCSDDDRALISVRDTGHGISPEEIAVIFELFRQSKRNDGRKGMGLGLALAKGIVELHGGQLGVTSAGVGKGSTFTVAIPLCPRPVHYDPTDVHLVVEELLHSKTTDQSSK